MSHNIESIAFAADQDEVDEFLAGVCSFMQESAPYRDRVLMNNGTSQAVGRHGTSMTLSVAPGRLIEIDYAGML